MKKILVIDYDQSSLTSLQGILAKEGYEVVTAADGQAGWDKYNKESPDLVLMEAMLPKVHGFELCQRITSERNSQATVFIMTGVYKDRVYRTEALRTYGASEYFEKPLKMAELLVSIEAVLGKPEPKPLEASPAAPEPAPARPAREIRPEPAPGAEPRRREKPKSDDDEFSLPADLDRLSREIPKIKKPGPARHETPAEARLESLADELLKSVVVESTHPKTVEPKPTGGNGNGRETADIDQFLKSALADFDLEKEKVKVPKTVPPPPPPPTVFKPKPTPPPPPVIEKPAAEKPKLAPLPDDGLSVLPKPATRSTLTPGDPGSDVSPFFTPAKPKPEVPPEKPKVQAPPAPPVVTIPSPKPFQTVDKPERKAAPAPVYRPQPEPVKHEPVKHEPPKREPVRPEPIRHEPKAREAEAIASTDIFQDIKKKKAKKGFPVLAAVGVGVAGVAVAGFLILRPKPAAPVNEGLKAQRTVTQTNTPVQPVVEPPPPEVKAAPVKPKPKPQAKKADAGVVAEDAILLPVSPSGAPPLTGSDANATITNTQGAAGANAAQAETPPVKTEEKAPPVKTEENPPQGGLAAAGGVTDPGAAAANPTAAEAPVKEGDLVDLSAVTEQPKLLKSAEPVYPPTAQRLGLGGSITVNALIDEKGNVIDTGILKGMQDDKGLGKAAENAVKKFKFEPARKNGVAVKVWKAFVIIFKPVTNSASTIE